LAGKEISMPFVLQTTTNPGAALWTELGTLSGGVQTISKRVTMADMPAAINATIDFDDPIPALAIVHGASFYLTAPPTGGTDLICAVTPTNPYSGSWFIGADVPPASENFAQLVGAPIGFPVPSIRSTDFPINSLDWPLANSATPFTPAVIFGGSANLNTFADLDVTLYIFYSLPANFSIPV
jgi:hypothetical protein